MLCFTNPTWAVIKVHLSQLYQQKVLPSPLQAKMIVGFFPRSKTIDFLRQAYNETSIEKFRSTDLLEWVKNYNLQSSKIKVRRSLRLWGNY